MTDNVRPSIFDLMATVRGGSAARQAEALAHIFELAVGGDHDRIAETARRFLELSEGVVTEWDCDLEQWVMTVPAPKPERFAPVWPPVVFGVAMRTPDEAARRQVRHRAA